ncbi:MAG: tRNA pseudouridine(55) synthase TruB [Syntrophomonadaceae bacterium]|nr:tRNA pseudouridine(55) synthase TruB [Syntrophomonadaceae bacterium]
MDGFLNINKPEGISSYDVIRNLKKIIPRSSKLGHLGTLDPWASGVLPVAVGRATRVIQYLEDERKLYIAEMVLGAISDTEDSHGNISYTGTCLYQEERLLDILASLQGRIEQIPPMYSALHHQGKRLYQLARQGITVERKPRKIEIYSIQLLSQKLENHLPRLTIEVSCSRGTYIRSLCRDIGEKLGTGAYMSRLIRKGSGVFKIEDSTALKEIMDNPHNLEGIIYPLDYPLQNIPALKLYTAEQDIDIINGKSLKWDEALSSGLARVYSSMGNLLALAQIKEQNGMLLIQPKTVFIPG